MARPLGHHADDTFTMPATRHDRVGNVEATHAAWLAVARAIFGGYFVFSGLEHFANVSMLAAFAGSKGVPSPHLAVLGTGLLIFVGGISLILGLWPRVGAACIMLFLVGVTPMMHDFWNATDPQARMNDFANFFKNVALFGGACFAMAISEPWPGSIHARRQAAADAVM